MVDGAALLTTFLHGMRSAGMWSGGRGENMLDGGVPFYDVYEAADGQYVAVGALEERFYADLVRVLGLEDAPSRNDPANWPELRERIAAAVKTRSRDEWADLARDTDACLAPVLTPAEAARHPYNEARAAFVDVAGAPHPAPAAPVRPHSRGGSDGPGSRRGEHRGSACRHGCGGRPNYGTAAVWSNWMNARVRINSATKA